MDLLSELEDMATAVEDYSQDIDHTDGDIATRTVERWKALFGFSAHDVNERIIAHRQDLSRRVVSQDHWEMVREDRADYDEEAYEYEINYSVLPVPQQPETYQQRSNAATYLLKLGGPFNLPEKIKEAASLDLLPEIRTSDEGIDSCLVDGESKVKILDWLASNDYFTYRPLFVRLSQAAKDLHPRSLHPTLGISSTIPQYRLDSVSDIIGASKTNIHFGTSSMGISASKRS